MFLIFSKRRWNSAVQSSILPLIILIILLFSAISLTRSRSQVLCRFHLLFFTNSGGNLSRLIWDFVWHWKKLSKWYKGYKCCLYLSTYHYWFVFYFCPLHCSYFSPHISSSLSNSSETSPPFLFQLSLFDCYKPGNYI